MKNEKNGQVEEILKVATVRYDPVPKTAVATGLPRGLHLRQRLQKLVDLLSPTTSALEATAYLRRIDDVVEESMKGLLPEANGEFKVRTEAIPGCSQVIAGECLFAPYEKPAPWAYPATIVALEAQLKKEKEIAQLDGTAKRIPIKIDPEQDRTFKITVAAQAD